MFLGKQTFWNAFEHFQELSFLIFLHLWWGLRCSRNKCAHLQYIIKEAKTNCHCFLLGGESIKGLHDALWQKWSLLDRIKSILKYTNLSFPHNLSAIKVQFLKLLIWRGIFWCKLCVTKLGRPLRNPHLTTRAIKLLSWHYRACAT